MLPRKKNDKNGVIWRNLGASQKYVITNLKSTILREKSQQENLIGIFFSQINLDEHVSPKTNTFRNVQGGSGGLKSVAYKTLVRPQLEYASTVWYPQTTTAINKVEAVRRRAARWATRDYRYTSSVTAMLKDLNWRPLDQRRIDSRLVMMYKVTYDLVAIPASDYLAQNTRTSRHIQPLAYRQIQTLKDYYRFTLERPPCQHTDPSHPGTV